MIEPFKNPFTIWLSRFIKSRLLMFKNRSKHLKIGFGSTVINSSFGDYNKLSDYINLKHCSLGDYSYVSRNTNIARTKIGKFCSIGPNCEIGLGKHPSSQFVSTHPIFYSTNKQSGINFSNENYFEEFDEISIGNDVWIGANVIINDGVTISDGAIVAAGSVVTKDIPPYAIAGGIPSKVIKYRFNENEIKNIMMTKWWDYDSAYLKENFKSFHNIDTFLKDKKSV